VEIEKTLPKKLVLIEQLKKKVKKEEEKLEII